jgi:energy-coupling factor transporter ATP-binding protein EcfA2
MCAPSPLPLQGDAACLQHVTVALPKGLLTVLVGPVGAGKSSLLAALMGEMELREGGQLERPCSGSGSSSGADPCCCQGRWSGGAGLQELQELPGAGPGGGLRGCGVPCAAGKLLVCPQLARPGARVAYVGQSPWVQSGSVLDNILLGRPLEPRLLHEVGDVKALCVKWGVEGCLGGGRGRFMGRAKGAAAAEACGTTGACLPAAQPPARRTSQVLHACALDVDLEALRGGVHARVGDAVRTLTSRPLPGQ